MCPNCGKPMTGNRSVCGLCLAKGRERNRITKCCRKRYRAPSYEWQESAGVTNDEVIAAVEAARREKGTDAQNDTGGVLGVPGPTASEPEYPASTDH